jgi:zinc transport system substrate-binding protein
MTPWRVRLLAVLVLLSCGAAADDAAPVVASIRPLALIVRALTADTLPVAVLPGVDTAPHDFVLRPSGLQAIRAAPLFLWMGPSLERPLARVLERNAGVPALAVLPALGEAAGADPHLWLDPGRASAIARVVAAELGRRGLLQADAAEAASARFAQAMDVRASAMEQAFAGVEQVPFVVMHDGLRALVARFGLRQVAALPVTHDAQPGARTVAALRRVAREQHAVCLFHEPGDSADLARTLAEGSAMRIVVLDTLALDAPQTAHGFDLFLDGIARGMAECLRAAPLESP